MSRARLLDGLRKHDVLQQRLGFKAPADFTNFTDFQQLNLDRRDAIPKEVDFPMHSLIQHHSTMFCSHGVFKSMRGGYQYVPK